MCNKPFPIVLKHVRMAIQLRQWREWWLVNVKEEEGAKYIETKPGCKKSVSQENALRMRISAAHYWNLYNCVFVYLCNRVFVYFFNCVFMYLCIYVFMYLCTFVIVYLCKKSVSDENALRKCINASHYWNSVWIVGARVPCQRGRA